MAHAPRERTAVAAVEEQHDPARSAPAHLHVDELGRQSGRRQVARLGVGRGEVERPVFVLDAVTGEMQQQDVFPGGVAKEPTDRTPEQVLRFVAQDVDSEVADRRIAEDPGELFGVMGG